MTAPRIAGARRVLTRYGAGVYRFPNGHGLSVAEHHDMATGLIDGWDAVEVAFYGDGPEDFSIPEWDMRYGLSDAGLAAFAAEIRSK